MARHAPHGDYDYPHEDVWCQDLTPPPRRRSEYSTQKHLEDLAFRLDHLEQTLKDLYQAVQELRGQRPQKPPEAGSGYEGAEN